MRKFFFFAILAIGAGVGLLFTVATKGDWGLGLVALGAGLLFAIPIAGALTGFGPKRRKSRRQWRNPGISGVRASLFKRDVPIRRWDR